MKTIFIDLDDTLCNFSKLHKEWSEKFDAEFPQGIKHFFQELEIIKDASRVVNRLIDSEIYDVWILSSPSVMNPNSYTEKRLWVESYFGFDFCHRLILATDKSLVRGHGSKSNNFLIDDCTEGKGQDGFYGKLIHFGSERFPDWNSVEKYFFP